MHQPPPSRREVAAVFISRQLRDDTVVVVGTGLPVPRAGVLLAHFTHAPNMSVLLGPYICSLGGFQRVLSFEFFADSRYSRYAEALMGIDEMMEADGLFDVFFVSGLQVDKHGNVNLIGVGPDYRALSLRGPGPVGIATLTTNSRRFIIYLERHDPRVLVDRCDYVTAMGWVRDGVSRRALGLRGGPEFIITPLCIFSFEEGRARLRYLLPGVSLEDVVRRTGFEFDHSGWEPVEPPDEFELKTLRERVDPEGWLRREST